MCSCGSLPLSQDIVLFELLPAIRLTPSALQASLTSPKQLLWTVEKHTKTREHQGGGQHRGEIKASHGDFAPPPPVVYMREMIL